MPIPLMVLSGSRAEVEHDGRYLKPAPEAPARIGTMSIAVT